MTNQIKMTFLGSGSTFTVGENNYHSNVLFESVVERDNLLFDCGSDIRFSMHALDLQAKDIQHVYISHLHSDHVGGLEWLGFSTYFDTKCSRPGLLVTHDIVDALWQQTLSGGMLTLEEKQAELSTYFDVSVIGAERSFTWQSVVFNLIKMMHVASNHEDVPCYGVIFSVGGQTIFLTGDTQFNPQLLALYQQADIIFQDCETSPVKSAVHAHFDELVTLPASIKQKMWLYHYNSGDKPCAQSAGFRGYVAPRQSFIF